MPETLGSVAFALAFQKSPIVLTGGIAQNVPGGMLPIIVLTQPFTFSTGLLTGANPFDLDDSFADFYPAPGSTLVEYDFAKYPFANQTVAANAAIAQPPKLSVLMVCPARGPFGYANKLATMTSLVAAVQQHVEAGGTWTVMTPAFPYTNGLLRAITDASGGESKQAQSAYIWDFEFPLLTLEQAQQAQNSLMSKLGSGTQVLGQPSTSGIASTTGDPSSLAAPALMPSSTGTPGTNIAPLASVPSAPVPSAPVPSAPVPSNPVPSAPVP